MFSSLVYSLIELVRSKTAAKAHAVDHLIESLQNDLYDAIEASSPLVAAYPTEFETSRTFLHFLSRIAQHDLVGNDKKKIGGSNDELRELEYKLNRKEKELDTLKENNERVIAQVKENLSRRFDEKENKYKQSLETCNETLQTVQKEMDRKISDMEKQLSNTTQQNKDLKTQNDMYKTFLIQLRQDWWQNFSQEQQERMKPLIDSLPTTTDYCKTQQHYLSELNKIKEEKELILQQLTDIIGENNQFKDFLLTLRKYWLDKKQNDCMTRLLNKLPLPPLKCEKLYCLDFSDMELEECLSENVRVEEKARENENLIRQLKESLANLQNVILEQKHTIELKTHELQNCQSTITNLMQTNDDTNKLLNIERANSKTMSENHKQFTTVLNNELDKYKNFINLLRQKWNEYILKQQQQQQKAENLQHLEFISKLIDQFPEHKVQTHLPIKEEDGLCKQIVTQLISVCNSEQQQLLNELWQNDKATNTLLAKWEIQIPMEQDTSNSVIVVGNEENDELDIEILRRENKTLRNELKIAHKLIKSKNVKAVSHAKRLLKKKIQIVNKIKKRQFRKKYTLVSSGNVEELEDYGQGKWTMKQHEEETIKLEMDAAAIDGMSCNLQQEMRQAMQDSSNAFLETKLAENERLVNTVDDLNQKIILLQGEKDELTKQIYQIQHLNSQLQNQIEEKENELTDMQQQKVQSQTQFEEIVEKQKQYNQNIKDKYEKAMSKNATLRDEIQTLLRTSKETQDDLKQQVETLKVDKERLQQEHESDLKTLTETYEHKLKQLQTIIQPSPEKRGRSCTIDELVDEMQVEISKLQHEKRQLVHEYEQKYIEQSQELVKCQKELTLIQENANNDIQVAREFFVNQLKQFCDNMAVEYKEFINDDERTFNAMLLGIELKFTKTVDDLQTQLKNVNESLNLEKNELQEKINVLTRVYNALQNKHESIKHDLNVCIEEKNQLEEKLKSAQHCSNGDITTNSNQTMLETFEKKWNPLLIECLSEMGLGASPYLEDKLTLLTTHSTLLANTFNEIYQNLPQRRKLKLHQVKERKLDILSFIANCRDNPCGRKYMGIDPSEALIALNKSLVLKYFEIYYDHVLQKTPPNVDVHKILSQLDILKQGLVNVNIYRNFVVGQLELTRAIVSNQTRDEFLKNLNVELGIELYDILNVVQSLMNKIEYNIPMDQQ